MVTIELDTMAYRTRSCSLASSAIWRASKPAVGACAPDCGRPLPERAHRMMEKERKHE
jgi:hypothetical protein